MMWYILTAFVVIAFCVILFKAGYEAGYSDGWHKAKDDTDNGVPTPKYCLTLDYVEGDNAYYTDIYGQSWVRRVKKGVDPSKIFVPKRQPLPNYARLRR